MIFSCSVATLLLSAETKAAQDRELLVSALAERRRVVLQNFGELPDGSGSELAAAAARFAAQEKLPEASKIFAAQLRQPSHDLFYHFSVIAAYWRGEKSLPDSLKVLAQRHFSVNPIYRGRSELDWHLYYSTILLVAQAWPQATASEWFNGKSSEENQREASEYLLQWMQNVAARGQKEFDSPSVLPEFLAPLFVLCDFAGDPEFRHRARMILDLLLADFAAEHLAGQYVGAHSRKEAAFNLAPAASPASSLAWLLFGAGEMAPSAELLFAALSSYEAPAVVLGMGLNRSESYVHRERKPPAALYRRALAGSDFGDVRKYTYVTSHYAVGSMTGGLAHPYAQQSWAVNYVNAGDRHPLFFATHPYAGDQRLGMFFPDPLRVLASSAAVHDAGFADPKKLYGASPYETIFQHRNVLIVLYDIPEAAANPWVNGFLSKDLTIREQQDDGWMFCQMGQTFLAVRFLRPVEFKEMPEGWRLVSHGRRNAVIVEAGSVDDCPSFEEFKRRFAGAKVSSSNITAPANLHSTKRDAADADDAKAGKAAGAARVIYTSSYGDVYELSSTGQRKLNGYPPAAGRWPRFDGPFMKSDERKNAVLLRNAKLWRLLDFAKWEIRDVDGTFGAELTRKR